jgi:hypothetical protein
MWYAVLDPFTGEMVFSSQERWEAEEWVGDPAQVVPMSGPFVEVEK